MSILPQSDEEKKRYGALNPQIMNPNLTSGQSPTLQQLATMFLLSNQNLNKQQPIETANVGGNNLLVNRPTGFNERLGAGLAPLQALATNFLMMQKIKKWDSFKNQIHTIMQASTTQEEKMKALYRVGLQFPEEWQTLGGKEIIEGYSKMYGDGWKPKTQQEAIAFEKARAGIKKETALELAKEKAGLKIKPSAGEVKAQTSYLTKPPIKQVGIFDPRRILSDFAYFNDTTQKVVANIQTVADLQELLRDRKEYEAQGVNVQAIIDYYKSNKK